MSRAEGRALAQASLDLAFGKAERDSGGAFGPSALAFFVRYAREAQRPVSVPEARLAAGASVPMPEEKRAWGAIPKMAERLGCVRHAGYAASSDPKSHACPRSLWLYVKDIPTTT